MVRRGYDTLSLLYDEAYNSDTKCQPWLASLNARLGEGSRVLDLGCGSGVPVVRDLAEAGPRVTGVDISEVQIRRVQELVPQTAIHRIAARLGPEAGDGSSVRRSPCALRRAGPGRPVGRSARR
ncbi:class I SAM-dependent methyltransferase [Streptomyces sp. FXJ1.172]|uniref:class I SAM-dependent methyltransferase n=1 Tax=Streptomyces sp. FXJ1.172 TaxID=710705 RepID=UPI0009A01B0C|nr:class I SAM-dependent methyltransferase [Streptomyces sp. FXJ1.172]WEP00156.1 class I SAM-dependent methyltransferase [Streptomyces sp. FXJ1.172]